MTDRLSTLACEIQKRKKTEQLRAELEAKEAETVIDLAALRREREFLATLGLAF